MDIIEWIEKWYADQCDGEWEHEYGIKITNVDNPGWLVEIDLQYTTLEELQIPYTPIEISDTDWFGYSITDSLFRASGDPTKLAELLAIFRRIVEETVQKSLE